MELGERLLELHRSWERRILRLGFQTCHKEIMDGSSTFDEVLGRTLAIELNGCILQGKIVLISTIGGIEGERQAWIAWDKIPKCLLKCILNSSTILLVGDTVSFSVSTRISSRGLLTFRAHLLEVCPSPAANDQELLEEDPKEEIDPSIIPTLTQAPNIRQIGIQTLSSAFEGYSRRISTPDSVSGKKYSIDVVIRAFLDADVPESLIKPRMNIHHILVAMNTACKTVHRKMRKTGNKIK